MLKGCKGCIMVYIVKYMMWFHRISQTIVFQGTGKRLVKPSDRGDCYSYRHLQTFVDICYVDLFIDWCVSVYVCVCVRRI